VPRHVSRILCRSPFCGRGLQTACGRRSGPL
jgi:hypothetical protein